MFFSIICFIICTITIAGAYAGEVNETIVISEGQSNDLIEIGSHDEVLQSVANESGTACEGHDDVLVNENEDLGNGCHGTLLKETSIDDELGVLDNDCLKANITIDTFKITVNSTRKVAIKFFTVGDMDDVDIDDFDIGAYCTEGNVTRMINIINREIDGRMIMLEFEHANFTSATLDIRYKGSEFNVTLNRKYNVKVELINNVVEYQSGKLIYRLTDIDLNEPLSNKSVSIEYRIVTGSISINGVSGSGITIISTIINTTDENGILTIDHNKMNGQGWGYMDAGNHNVTIKSYDFEKIENSIQEILIKRASIDIKADDYVQYYDSDEKYNITVTNAETGNPIKNTVLHLYLPLSSQKDYYLQTNENGTCQISFKGFSGGTYELTISNNDTRNINNRSVKANITILPEPMNISAANIFYGNDLIIEVVLAQMFSGAIKTSIANQTYWGNVTNGRGYITIPDLGAGIYDVNVNFTNGNMTTSNSTTFEIYKTGPSLKVEYGPINVSGIITIHIIQPEHISGNITICINGENSTSEIVDGIAEFKIGKLKAGGSAIDVYYSGDNNYLSSNFTDQIMIMSLDDAKLDLKVHNICVGDNILILPSIKGDAVGTFDIYVDDEFKATIDVGNSYLLLGAEVGNHEIKVIYSGDVNYESSSIKKVFKVYNIFPIESNDTQIIFTSAKRFQAKFFDVNGNVLVNKYVIFNVDGNDFSVRTDENGVAVLDMDLAMGNHSVISINPVANENRTNSILVFSSIQSIDTYAVNDADFEFNATFFDEYANKLTHVPIVFRMNGTDKVIRTDDEGVATLKLNLDIGIYDIISINTITDESKENKLYVKSSSTGKYTHDIDDKDIKVKWLDTGSGTITLPSDALGSVTIDIAGKKYSFDILNGVANVNLPNLANGNYRYVFTYSGDVKYSSFTKSGSLIVEKNTVQTKPQAKTTLVLKTVKVKKSAKKLVLQATLKQGNKALSGKKIIFKFNGKKYTVKTNKKGIAKVTIKRSVLKKLKVGKKVKYQASYGKTIAKKTVKVKK